MNLCSSYPTEINLFAELPADLNRYIVQLTWGSFKQCHICQKYYSQDYYRASACCWYCIDPLDEDRSRQFRSICHLFYVADFEWRETSNLPWKRMQAYNGITLPYFCWTFWFDTFETGLHAEDIDDAYIECVLAFSKSYNVPRALIPRDLIVQLTAEYQWLESEMERWSYSDDGQRGF